MRYLLAAALAAIAGCTRGMTSVADPSIGTVSGTLVSPDPVELPVWSQITVVLLDTSGEAGPVEIGSVLLQGERRPPIPFSIDFERAEVHQDRTYALEASVMVRGDIRFTGDFADVDLGPHGTHVEIALAPANVTDPFLADVVGSDWSVTSLGGDALLANTSVLTRFTADGKVAGRAQNRFGGTYEQADDTLHISPLAATRMYLNVPMGAMDQESKFLELFEDAKSWSLDGDTLTITTAAGPTIEFARKPFDE